MNPKDIVYKMVVLGRRLTTHFILDIFWGSSFMCAPALSTVFPIDAIANALAHWYSCAYAHIGTSRKIVSHMEHSFMDTIFLEVPMVALATYGR